MKRLQRGSAVAEQDHHDCDQDHQGVTGETLGDLCGQGNRRELQEIIHDDRRFRIWLI